MRTGNSLEKNKRKYYTTTKELTAVKFANSAEVNGILSLFEASIDVCQ